MKTYAYGFPKLGKQREFKRLVEGLWEGKIGEGEFREGIEKLKEKRLKVYSRYVNGFPLGEVSLYDHVLDDAVLYGIYKVETLSDYFNLCRGKGALEMKKWFNTNYHYLVPDFEEKLPPLKLHSLPYNKFEGKENVYLLGPFTFLKLSKGIKKEHFEGLLTDLVRLTVDFVKENAFSSVHLDDPALVMELSEREWKIVEKVYSLFEELTVPVNLFTYYDSVDRLELLFSLPFAGIGVDLVHDRGENLKKLERIPSVEKRLYAGVIDGRNVWRNDLFKTRAILEKLSEKFDVVITNAAPLYHLPVSLEGTTLPKELVSKVAFAEEKLKELKLLSDLLTGKAEEEAKIWTEGLNVSFGVNQEVRERISTLKESDFNRNPSYRERVEIQKRSLKLPLFPTTTIGSFPQTEEVRRIRLLYRKGRLDEGSYETFIKGEIAKAIKIQEELGLDVLVHGEFERTDMVEFFAEKLEGIATTGNGWVISYGTRCYRPPIIYGDVFRKEPMTLKEIAFAQSLTEKPVKGMLTGPVTIISWSYVREDLPLSEVAYQIALAIKDEIKDYEDQGIKIVQIDEPAIREKAPIKKRHWDSYFEWAVKAFRLSISSAKPETQIHTHMCYSEFSEIINYIMEMDFDVISIEATRSKGEIIEAFENVQFDRQIGLGVWDIHSPYVPSVKEMEEIAERALKVIPAEQFWVNPDCGLKTRRWEEVIPALKNLVNLAKNLRNKYSH